MAATICNQMQDNWYYVHFCCFLAACNQISNRFQKCWKALKVIDTPDPEQHEEKETKGKQIHKEQCLWEKLVILKSIAWQGFVSNVSDTDTGHNVCLKWICYY